MTLQVRNVSIHAPVKSATERGAGAVVRGGVSIHAPVKSATVSASAWRGWRGRFNPRTREECDQSTNINNTRY